MKHPCSPRGSPRLPSPIPLLETFSFLREEFNLLYRSGLLIGIRVVPNFYQGCELLQRAWESPRKGVGKREERRSVKKFSIPTACQACFKLRATAVLKSTDRIKFDFSTAVARCLKQASPFSRVAVSSRAHVFHSLYYPWGKMRTTPRL